MNYLDEIKQVIERDCVNQIKYDYYKDESKVKTYFEVGRLLFIAQGGKERAKYGNELIKKWSIELTALYGKGYDVSNLKKMRKFYIIFEKGATLWHQLNWSTIKRLISIDNISKRNYYINICIKQNLSVRNLRDLIKSNAYERLSYKDKEDIKLLDNNTSLTIQDMIKEPMLIEIPSNIDVTNLKEKVLEQIIIEKLEKVFMELGVGFTYAGSQVRMGNSYCDLLFFNTELNCYVVIELKLRKLIKQDIGQIEYYMNYVDSNIKKYYHNVTEGIIICKENNHLIMKYCSNPHIFKTTYELVVK